MMTEDDDFANRIIGTSSSSTSHAKLAAIVHLPQRYSSTTSSSATSSSSQPPFTHTLLMSAMKAHPSSSTSATAQESYPTSATHTAAAHKDRPTSLRCRFNIDEPEDTAASATTITTHRQQHYNHEADDEDDDAVLDSDVSMVTKKVRLPSTGSTSIYSNSSRAGGAGGVEREGEEVEYNVIDAVVDISTNEESSPFMHTLGNSYTPSYR